MSKAQTARNRTKAPREAGVPSAGAEALQAEAAAQRQQAEEEGPPPAPWHFKVLLVATALYLVYRFIWFIFWLTGHAWHG